MLRMKQGLVGALGSVVLIGGVAHAEVPDLAGAIQSLDAAQMSAFEADIGSSESVISADIDFAFDTAVVNEALEQGLITEAEAADLDSALAVVEANQEFFDFDIANMIATLIASGGLTPAQAAETLALFDSLSDADKTIVGQESFSPWADGGCSSNCTVANLATTAAYQSTEFKSLSSDGQTKVLAAPFSLGPDD